MAARKATAPEPQPVNPPPAEVSTPPEGEAHDPDVTETPTDDQPEGISPSDESPEAHIERLLAEQAAAAAAADVEPKTVVMAITITGTRDGKPWPRPGKKVTLPADEAQRMLQLGYAVEDD